MRQIETTVGTIHVDVDSGRDSRQTTATWGSSTRSFVELTVDRETYLAKGVRQKTDPENLVAEPWSTGRPTSYRGVVPPPADATAIDDAITAGLQRDLTDDDTAVVESAARADAQEWHVLDMRRVELEQMLAATLARQEEIDPEP